MLVPLNNNVIVEKENKEERKTPIGIVVPDTTAPSVYSTGKVTAIGPGKVDIDGNIKPISGIKINDKVVYKNYVGTEVEESGKKYVIIADTELLAKLKD